MAELLERTKAFTSPEGTFGAVLDRRRIQSVLTVPSNYFEPGGEQVLFSSLANRYVVKYELPKLIDIESESFHFLSLFLAHRVLLSR